LPSSLGLLWSVLLSQLFTLTSESGSVKELLLDGAGWLTKDVPSFALLAHRRGMAGTSMPETTASHLLRSTPSLAIDDEHIMSTSKEKV
jgi:hypothetical protein